MKNLIVLILCLSLPLLASSQKPSNDSTCCVPCNALKKALVVKTERDYLKTQLEISRDSSLILSRIVNNQDSLINVKDSSISMYKENEANFNHVISNKDSVITLCKGEINRQKGLKYKAYAASIIVLILGLII